MNKIGLFPGTFDPFHMGHLGIAERVMDHLLLDKIILIPSPNPPHKELKNPASPEERFEIVRIATKGREKFEISDYEMKKDGVDYTIDTVRHFSDKYPDSELWLIIGGDSLSELGTWKDIEEYPKYVKIAAVSRGTMDCVADDNLSDNLLENLVTVENVHFPQSSTEIKKKLENGEDVSDDLHPGVIAYIKERNLYV